MNRTKQRLHRAACFSFMLLALFLIKTDIGFCAAPTLEWTGAEGLWNDGVAPDYGISPTLNSLNPLCTALSTPYECCTDTGTGTCNIPDNSDCTGLDNPYACCTGAGTGYCDNSDCTAVDIPYDCCTGAGTGTCNSFNSLCAASGDPYDCCTGAGTGTCTSFNSANNYCTASGDPYDCCTGAGTGTCNSFNSLCAASGDPYVCCTGAGTGTCNTPVNSLCTAENDPYPCCTGTATGNCTSDDFTFTITYKDTDNHPPKDEGLAGGYPKVHILKDGIEIDNSPFTMTETDSGDTTYTDGKDYTYYTSFSLAGNDYTYYFEAKDSNDETAPTGPSPTREHTLTGVTGYVWIDPGGTNNLSCGTQGSPCQTIAYGISRASPGQAVKVKEGTYSPNASFTMASGVHVVSDNSAGGDSQDTYDDPYSEYDTSSILTRTGRTVINGGITFPAGQPEDVTVDGITIDYTPGKSTMDIADGSPVIKNNIVRRNDSGVSLIEMSANNVVDDVPIIENNRFHSVADKAIGISSYTSPIIQDNEIWDTGDQGIGINRKGVAGGEVTILNNHIFNCGGAGIGSTGLVSNTTYQFKIVIQGNSIHDSGHNPLALRAGIRLKRCCTPGPSLEIVIGGSDPSLGNSIYNNGMAGIRLDGGNMGLNPVLIQNNTIYDNGKAGIRLIDVGSLYDPPGPGPVEITYASIIDNTISGQTQTGINIGGSTYADIMYNTIYNNYSGIAFQDGSRPSSGMVNIEDNKIFINTRAGITVRDAITGEVTIARNDILYNVRAGIGIINSCNLDINRNEIHDNYRAGIRTGGFVDNDYFANSNTECTAAGEPYPCCTGLATGTCNSSVGFIGPLPDPGVPEGAFLDVSQNKVYGNGTSGYGAGINIRHASGTVYNNLVYGNTKGGIRYGDYIEEIINNTVVNNGNDLFDGSGILYDSLDGYVDEWPPSGDGPAIPIRNNISVLNTRTGIKTGTTECLSGDYRDYNLLYGNNGTSDELPPFMQSYYPMQLCGCDPHDNEIFADPLFVDPDGVDNIAGNGDDDYRIQVTSPAVDSGDDTYGTDVSVPPGVGTTAIDMGAYGGPYGIDW